MNYPSSAYSWDVLSDDVAIKHMDKSSFLHHGTGLPREIASFFELPENGLLATKPIQLLEYQKDNELQRSNNHLKQLMRAILWLKLGFCKMQRGHVSYARNQVHFVTSWGNGFWKNTMLFPLLMVVQILLRIPWRYAPTVTGSVICHQKQIRFKMN